MSTRCMTRAAHRASDRSPRVAADQGTAVMVNLDQLSPGQGGRVEAVPPEELLPALSIRCGKQLILLARSIASGPLLVRVDGRTIAIDRAIARQITLTLGD